jgi:N4-gp56 family major capsid protein
MASDFATTPTTTSTYDDVSYAAIINDEVLDALMATVVSPQLLAKYPLEGKASKAVKIPKASKFTAAAVAEGTELINTALTTDSVTITAAEIGIQATVTDVLEVSDIPAAHGARLRQLGRAIGDKIDVDVCALLGGFSSAVGATTVNIALTNVLDAIYTLEAADAASLGSIVGLLHPRQTGDLRTELEADAASLYVGKSDGSIGKAQAGYFGSWFGVDIFQSTNVPTANADADRAGAFFIRDYALGMATKWMARVETLRWPSIRGWVLVATAMYGVGEVEDSAGVEAVTDA